VPALSQTRAHLALVAIVALWGSYPATGKLAVEDFTPFVLSAVRCTLASAFLLALLFRSGEPVASGLTWASVRVFFVLGAAGIWGSMQWSYVGYYHTTAGNAAILQAGAPVMVALTARLYLGERLRGRQWLGVAVSALGVLLVVTRGRFAALRIDDLRAGDFITVASLTGWAVYTVYGKRVLGTLSPALATTGAYVAGTLLIYPTALVTAPLYPAPRLASFAGWFVVFYQGVIGAVAHVWWYRAVQVVGPSRSAIFMNLQPVVGIALAAVLVREPIGVWQLGGTALVLLGVGLTTARGEP